MSGKSWHRGRERVRERGEGEEATICPENSVRACPSHVSGHSGQAGAATGYTACVYTADRANERATGGQRETIYTDLLVSG